MASDRTAGAANEASGLAAIFRRVCRVMDGSMVDTDESVLGGMGVERGGFLAGARYCLATETS